MRDYLTQSKRYKCPNCEHPTFKTGQSLGGHVAKVHPGMSNKYKEKIEKRNERQEKRALLERAKVKYFLEFGEGPITYRSKLNQIKKTIAYDEA